jgi:pimeloyl-ACP methyl ester carboxylesterase
MSQQHLEKGTGNKAIIFVHGNSSNAASWLPQLEDTQLQSHYRLIAMDLPGCGSSVRTGNYTLSALRDWLINFIRITDVPDYILAGVSYGTNIIGEAAPYLPEGCKGFFILSSNLTNNEHPPQSFIEPLGPLQALGSANVSDDLLKEFCELLFYKKTDKNIKSYSESYKNTDPSFRTAISGLISNRSWTDEWKNIEDTKLPCCIVFGKEEKAIRASYMDDFPSRWKDRTFLIDNSAHFPNLEQPDIFNALLYEFAEDAFK